MPNGNDVNWVRLRAALEGFFLDHGHWPSRVRMPEKMIEHLRRDLFSPPSWVRLTAQLQFVADEGASFLVEDHEGRHYSYGQQGFPPQRPSPTAEEWLGAEPDTPLAREH